MNRDAIKILGRSTKKSVKNFMQGIFMFAQINIEPSVSKKPRAGSSPTKIAFTPNSLPRPKRKVGKNSVSAPEGRK
ncbi:MAG: hypothetical protein Q7U74_01955 [Saprospiraceae bacterium]|nr:hypothetical protein [Saprospiraceae bacterium]